MKIKCYRDLRSRTILYLSVISVFLLNNGCGTPDLTDVQVLTEARREAIPIDSLQRKLMYGMIQLYVDKDENPFSGWVKVTSQNGKTQSLGFLKKGQKEGFWLEWYPNGKIKSKQEWHQDRYEGEFKVWHPNGLIKVNGQTHDGEVDGVWKSYYKSGKLASICISEVGLAVSAQVWKPDGLRCPRTDLKEGNGFLCEYEDNGSIYRVRKFSQGISRTLPNQFR